jgi:uncharacterized protein YjdB
MRQINEWINQFKIALIEKEYSKIEKLIAKMPQMENIEQMQTAQSLIQSAITELKAQKEQMQMQMAKLKKSKGYFNTQSSKKTTFFK